MSLHCTAFNGTKQIASGELRDVARRCRELQDRDSHSQILIFDDVSSELIEVDLRGTPAEVVERIGSSTETVQVKGPGRPRLGVVAREITLLPRHWEWLATQPGGASVALRKLVELAMKGSRDKDRVRHAQESAYRFMSAMAGNEPGFEEASRALFAGEKDRFHLMIANWPPDVRDHATKLAAALFGTEGS